MSLRNSAITRCDSSPIAVVALNRSRHRHGIDGWPMVAVSGIMGDVAVSISVQEHNPKMLDVWLSDPTMSLLLCRVVPIASCS